MGRVYNFSAGPATLPVEVLKRAADEMLDYNGSGMSVMEMSHRSKAFIAIYEEANKDLRDLLAIPDNYKIAWVQGGATTQFAMVPMNLMKNGVADYIVTGSWSKKASKEAKMYGDVHVVASSEDENFSYIPKLDEIEFTPNADYVYICQNETIHGTTYHELPNTGNIPLVSDVSSMFLSQPMDVSKYGIIFGGVQKNIGPAGVAIAIVRDDLLTDEVWPGTPTLMRYKGQVDADSAINTPACYTMYICGLVFKWLKEQGGLEAMYKRNVEKAQILYDFLDQSELFKGAVRKEDRSIMNVPFVTGDADMDKKFIAEATEAGLVELKGHRSVGGMRASIYNAMPKEGVEKLVAFMEDFEKTNK